MKRIIAISLIFVSLTLASCSSDKPSPSQPQAVQPQATKQQAFVAGRFDVQSISYNDLDGTYEIQLFGRTPPTHSTANVKLIPLAEGEAKTYAEIAKDETILHLATDTKIAYVATQTAQAPAVEGQPQQVVVQGQRDSFWEPFAQGYLISQMFGSSRTEYVPMAVYPPVYREGQPLQGVGGYGRDYESARRNYRKRNDVAPPAVRHSKLRTSGRLTAKPGVKLKTSKTSRSLTKTTTSKPVRTKARTTRKPSGSGVGSSNLRNKPSSRSRTTTRRSRPSSSFGSSRSRSRSRSRSSGSRRR